MSTLRSALRPLRPVKVKAASLARDDQVYGVLRIDAPLEAASILARSSLGLLVASALIVGRAFALFVQRDDLGQRRPVRRRGVLAR